MKINSKFKDYYDYLSHIYGADEKVVFNRSALVSNTLPMKYPGFGASKDKMEAYYKSQRNINSVTCKLDNNYGIQLILGRNNTYNYGGGYPFVHRVLVICGMPFVVIKSGEEYCKILHENSGTIDITNQEDSFNLSKYYHSIINDNYYIGGVSVAEFFNAFLNFNNIIKGKSLSGLDKIAKEINRPIYFIDDIDVRKSEVEISSYPPNLGELGVASLFPPEMMYQALMTYISGVMRDSPDLTPPIVRSDTEKVESHGFDKRISFRHRK